EEANGGLSKVGDFIDIQTVDREVGRLIHKTAVFGTYSEVLHHVEIDASSVNEGRASLTLRTGDEVFSRRIEDQSAGAGQSVRPDTPNGRREMRHKRSRDLVHVRL